MTSFQDRLASSRDYKKEVERAQAVGRQSRRAQRSIDARAGY
jgi:hypothetical protein